MYEKIDKELLEFVEDVLLNRCENATERMLEYAALLDPKSPPTKLRKLGGEPKGPSYSPRLNPIPAGFNPVAPPDVLPPAPVYKPWKDALKTTEAFDQLEKLFEERIAYIDGAMGTMIQRYKLQVMHEKPAPLLSAGKKLPSVRMLPAMLKWLATTRTGE